MIDLTTLDEVKCLIDTLQGNHDTELSSRITDVSAKAQQFINRDLELRSRTELYDGQCDMLFPREVPVISVTEVRTSVNLDFTNIGFIVPAIDYAIVNNGWGIFHNSVWPGRRKYGVQLEYLAGYLDADDPLSDLPVDLRLAIAKQVAYEFKNRKTIGLETVDLADGSITKTVDVFLDSVKQVLKLHRKKQLG